MVRVRYAPSPTGDLHLGNIRILVVNYLFNLLHKGEFFLRIDDTDQERSQKKYIDSILNIFGHFNLKYNKLLFQSKRKHMYEKVFKDLLDRDIIYVCYETPEEIEKIQRSKKRKRLAPIFTRKDRLYNQVENKNPYWRLNLANKMDFNDEIFGFKTYDRTWSDPIIKKTNGDFCYIFCSVVDDINENITHIIRGADHLSNSVIQQYLGDIILQKPWKVNFYHISMLTDQGHKLSKRSQTSTINVFDLEPETLFIIFSCLGTNIPQLISNDMEKIANNMDINKFNKGAVQCPSLQQILQVNKKVLRLRSEQSIKEQSINHYIWRCFKYNIESITQLIHINKEILSIDLNQLDFLKEFNSIDNINHQIDTYVLRHNLDKNQFLSKIRESVIGRKNGPQSNDILKMLIELKNSV